MESVPLLDNDGPSVRGVFSAIGMHAADQYLMMVMAPRGLAEQFIGNMHNS